MTNDHEIFWDLGRISKKFWRIEKFSINLGHIFKKKVNGRKTLEIFRKIGNIFGNFWERTSKKYEKVFEEIQSKFRVTHKKVWRN